MSPSSVLMKSAYATSCMLCIVAVVVVVIVTYLVILHRFRDMADYRSNILALKRECLSGEGGKPVYPGWESFKKLETSLYHMVQSIFRYLKPFRRDS